VASMSRGKKAYVQYERELSEAIARLAQLREDLKAAIDADAESYNAVMKAYKEAKAKEAADGEALIDAALKQATSVPLGMAEHAKEVVGIAEKLKPITNPNMKSDLTTGIALAGMTPAEVDSLVAEVARAGAAGIGLEPTHAGADVLTAACRASELPLLVFGRDVRFVDITHVVHERLYPGRD